MNNTRYAVVGSAFHADGLLWTGRSPREAYRALRRLRDGCHDGRGCQCTAISTDGGATWYTCSIERTPLRPQAYISDHAHAYADGIYTVWWDDETSKPLAPAMNTWSASCPAL